MRENKKSLRIISWIKNRFAQRGLILLYHRVADLSQDPQLLCVTPAHFAEQLEILRNNAIPVSLSQMAAFVSTGSFPRRAVTVTFDDGYADNLYHAKEVLEHYKVPGTVFVTTGKIGQQHEFWWDELDRLLLQPGVLPQTLSVDIRGEKFHWDLGEDARYDVESFRRHANWNVLDSSNPTRRHLIYRHLHGSVQPLRETERRTVIEKLRGWAGQDPNGRPSHHVLTAVEVARLAEGGLIDVGAHTVSHPSLARIPLTSQREEILKSKIHLEELLNRPVASFAYPYGTRSDYSEETVALVREAGFSCACSNFPGLVQRDTDVMQLPRMIVRDWDGKTFSELLSRWFSV